MNWRRAIVSCVLFAVSCAAPRSTNPTPTPVAVSVPLPESAVVPEVVSVPVPAPFMIPVIVPVSVPVPVASSALWQQKSLLVPPSALDGLLSEMRTKIPRFAGIGNHPSPNVTLTMFGDSHTAADLLASTLRIELSSRFGDAGRGFIAMGQPPVKHYYQRNISYGRTGTWDSAVVGVKDNPSPFGLSGIRMTTSSIGASAWVESCTDCLVGKRVDEFQLLYRRHHNGAAFRYQVDNQPWVTVASAQSLDEPGAVASQTAILKISVPNPPGSARSSLPHRLTLEYADTEGRALDLYGVALKSVEPGVVVDSLGLVGRKISQLAKWDWQLVGAQLATRAPGLVVLQYGSNEADDTDLDLSAVARDYDQVIAQIRTAVPSSSILILGPPDMARRLASCDSRRLHRGKKGSTKNNRRSNNCAWRTPAILPAIIEVQRQAALRNRVAFFDSFAAMGGANMMATWVKSTPSWAASDHTHFNELGSRHWGQLLAAALTAYMEASIPASATSLTTVPSLQPQDR
jgi:lysophospholipase L1-like esterase